MSSITKTWIIVGLIIGSIIGFGLSYVVLFTGVSTTDLEQQIGSLEGQVNSLQGQIAEKNSQISNLQSQTSALQSQISEKDGEISSFQSQIAELQEQVAKKDTKIEDLQIEIIGKNAQIVYLQSLLQPEEGTQVTIYDVKWEVDEGKVRIFIKNTGSTSATIESTKIRKNIEGEPWYVDDMFKFLFIGSTDVIVLSEAELFAPIPSDFIAYNTSYVIRVTCNTGDYHEIISLSPTS